MFILVAAEANERGDREEGAAAGAGGGEGAGRVLDRKTLHNLL